MYIGDKTSSPRVYEDACSDGRWEYAVALTPTNEFVQVSFVFLKEDQGKRSI